MSEREAAGRPGRDGGAERGPESREIRLKRLRIRSWRRGTREMDLILGPFADGKPEAPGLDAFDEAGLAAYEELLEENDVQLYAWISGREAPDAAHAGLVAHLRAWHGIEA